jgi:predicted transcriptional regulator
VGLFNSKLKVLDVLWREGDITAKRISEIMAEQYGWSKTTTYTIIKRCIDKGEISRREPNFTCHALVSKRQTQESQTTDLINNMYDGMSYQLVASVLGRKKLSQEEVEKLKDLVKKLT